MPIRAQVRVLDTQKQITIRLLRAVGQEMLRFMKGALPDIRVGIIAVVNGAIIDSPAYNSIIRGIGPGELRPELGIPDGATRLDSIIKIWLNSLTVNASSLMKKGNSVGMIINIGMIEQDWSDVLADASATLTGPKLKGAPLEWLRWLLIEGRKIIIREYKIEIPITSRQKQFSRTGLALMVKADRIFKSTGKKGRFKNWKVPDQFHGTTNNNWVTQALEDIDPLIGKVIEREILRHV